MTDFERPTCHICSEKIERTEGHIGPPFVEKPRHMKCAVKCKKCGAWYSDLTNHLPVCGMEPKHK